MENLILIGNKDFNVYLKSIDLLFKEKNLNKVVLKARGLNIKTAIDLAEVSKNKFFKEFNLTNLVTISTESFKDKESIERFVSCIEIVINKQLYK